MRRFIPALAFIVCIIVLWELVVWGFSIPEYLLPAPSVVFSRLFSIKAVLLTHTAYTAFESALGFITGSALGILLAVLFVHSRTLELGIYPYAIALKTAPIVAIAPLLIVWFGNGLLPKVIVAAIISFFPVVVNTTKGLRNVDPEAFDLFDSMSATQSQIFFKLRVPSALPYLFSALRISSTLAVIGAIVGEFAGSDRGLGFFIMISSHRLETVDMFVGILFSSLLGILFFYGIALLEKIVVPWGKHIAADTA
uniref:NitT/TauT family transport system permease protein n=1 Tax=Candidatus Kentrum eta TaxID=2126337 RepID=A0A450V5P0_9GAMM|nr:MAG: NitT/TauT family transport system permease protein [Candidatus Kentron sp. H]VFK00081.1 MAG: NitT/TauT family transport system permease protein [Candidatus Kentron sp. H]VFK04404.1 MAG: NitT/TauT family transport system permease protein [Candidatus Kentron sp. H]